MKKFLIPVVLLISLSNTVFLYSQDYKDTISKTTSINENLDNVKIETTEKNSTDEEYLKNINTSTEGDKILVTKLYEFPLDIDKKDVIKESYIQDKYEYVKIGIEETEIKSIDKKEINDEQSKEVSINNRNSIIDLFEDTIPYLDVEGYSGQIQRKDETLNVITIATTTKWHTLSDIKYYYKLPNKDISNINKSISKNGVSLNIISLEWIGTNNDNVSSNADTAISSLYTCKVEYSGQYSEKVPTKFKATIKYNGFAEKELIVGKSLKVQYLGEKIKEPEIIPMIELEPAKEIKKFNAVPIVAGTTTSGGLMGIVLFVLFKRNIHIYNMQSGRYELIGKQRIKASNPNIDITAFEAKTTTNIFKIVIAKSLIDSLVGKDITVSFKDRQTHHTVLSGGADYVFDTVL